MGRKREHFDWVEVRLEYWGRWVAKNVAGIGYASRTQEGRLMDEGPVGAKTNYREHSPNVEFAHKEHETDRAVQGLPSDWRYLLHRMYVDHKKPSEIASRHGWSKGWIRQTHDKAIAYLAGAIQKEMEANRSRGASEMRV